MGSRRVEILGCGSRALVRMSFVVLVVYVMPWIGSFCQSTLVDVLDGVV